MLPRTASVAPTLDPNGYTVAPIAVARLPYSSTLTSVLPSRVRYWNVSRWTSSTGWPSRSSSGCLPNEYGWTNCLSNVTLMKWRRGLRRLIGLRLRLRPQGGAPSAATRHRRRHGLYQHPFKDNVNRVSDSILAAVMTAPRQPIELREFPRPDLPAGAVLLEDVPVGSLRHRRAPLARPARRRAVPDHSRPRLRPASSTRRAGPSPASTARRFAKATGSCSSTSIARAAAAAPAPCTARRRGARRAASTASPIRRTRGCSADGRRRSIWSRASAMARLPDAVSLDDYIGGGCGLLTAVHIAERAEIRLGDTVVVQGVGRGRPERDRAGADRRRLADHRHRRARQPARARARDGRRPHAGPGRHDAARTAAGGPRRDPRRRRGRRDRGRRRRRRDRGGTGPGARRRPVRRSPATTRTSATARSTRTSRSIASTSRSAAAGAARRATFSARCPSSSAIPPFRSASIGARRYGLQSAE